MVPLSEQDNADEGAPGGSATTFFALPTPKRKKKEEEPAPPPPSSGPPAASSPPGGFAAAPGSVPPGGSMAPGMMGGVGIQGPVASGPVAGPVAGYPQAGAMPPSSVEEEINRAQSYRVFAIVIGLMFMVFSALIVTVGLGVYGLYMTKEANDDRTAAVVTPPPPPRQAVDADTGLPAPLPKPAPKTRPRSAAPSPAPAPRAAPAPSPAPAPAPEPAVGPAPVKITIPAGEPYTSVEVTCSGSGFRERASFSNGVATLPNVPREECMMHFKGGPPAQNRISGGETRACEFPRGQAYCQ